MGSESIGKLSEAQLEPLDPVLDRCLTFKTMFLLAITLLKKGDLQAMSVSLEFVPRMVKAIYTGMVICLRC